MKKIIGILTGISTIAILLLLFGYLGHTSNDVIQIDFNSNSEVPVSTSTHSQGTVGGLVYGYNSHSQSFKSFVKKKVKIRFRARYCELKLAPKAVAKKSNSFPNRVIVPFFEFFLSEQFAYSFRLRGPPSYSA